MISSSYTTHAPLLLREGGGGGLKETASGSRGGSWRITVDLSAGVVWAGSTGSDGCLEGPGLSGGLCASSASSDL